MLFYMWLLGRNPTGLACLINPKANSGISQHFLAFLLTYSCHCEAPACPIRRTEPHHKAPAPLTFLPMRRRVQIKERVLPSFLLSPLSNGVFFTPFIPHNSSHKWLTAGSWPFRTKVLKINRCVPNGTLFHVTCATFDQGSSGSGRKYPIPAL